jgi:aspartate/methionine/tyrosine aminotransferase
VILPDPNEEIAELIRRPGGVPVPIVLRPDRDFEYDPADIEGAITPRTKVIYVNTPHNPVGTVLSEKTLRQIADIAIRHNLAVVSDEAYEDVLDA